MIASTGALSKTTYLVVGVEDDSLVLKMMA